MRSHTTDVLHLLSNHPQGLTMRDIIEALAPPPMTVLSGQYAIDILEATLELDRQGALTKRTVPNTLDVLWSLSPAAADLCPGQGLRAA